MTDPHRKNVAAAGDGGPALQMAARAGRTGVLGVLVVLLALAALAAGCDLAGPEGVETDSEVVVEAYLSAGEPLPAVRIGRTVPIEERWRPEAAGVSGAEVRIARLGPEGAPVEQYTYRPDPEERGRYLPEDSARVEPLSTYRLRASVPGREEEIEARTVVPDTFRLLSSNRDTIVYQSSDQLRIQLSPSRYPDRQSVFVFTTVSLDPRVENLTPFAREFSDEDSAAVAESRVGSSPLLNEETYTAGPGGNLTIRLPWLAISFFGPNRLVARAVDENLRDFLRSHQAQSGQTTLAPGEIPSILDRVANGRGVFGSFAEAQLEVFIRRPPRTER